MKISLVKNLSVTFLLWTALLFSSFLSWGQSNIKSSKINEPKENIFFSELSFLSINSAITPATFDYLKQHFTTLPSSSFIVIKLNTPGGLVSTTKDIITMAAETKRPYAVWITPEGASASSAGAIISSSAHFIFMSPGTHIGAATPVGMGKDIEESDGRKKILNDLTALVRSMSSLRKRNPKPFEEMITEAKSFSAEEAKGQKIINDIISTKEDLISYLHKKLITLQDKKVTLHFKDTTSKNYKLSTGQKILEVLANPSTAYILFLLGVALLYFELQAPGGFISGAIGVCFLILSGISFQVLPLNWGSMGLIFLGLLLLVLEIFITSYGILTVSGIISFVLGSLFLFHGEAGFISIEYSIILSALAGVLLSVGFISWFLIKDMKKKKKSTHFFTPLGSQGEVINKLAHQKIQIKVQGEIWTALSKDQLEIGDQVKVESIDSQQLIVHVKKV